MANCCARETMGAMLVVIYSYPKKSGVQIRIVDFFLVQLSNFDPRELVFRCKSRDITTYQ